MLKRWQATTDSGLRYAGWAETPDQFAELSAKAAADSFCSRTTDEILIENLDDFSEAYEYRAKQFGISEIRLVRNSKFYCRYGEGNGFVVHAATAKVAAIRCYEHFTQKGYQGNGIVLINLAGSTHGAIEELRDLININVKKMLQEFEATGKLI